jgi:hypothetical protein
LPYSTPASLVAVTITHIVTVTVAIALVAVDCPSPDAFKVSQLVSQHAEI